MDSPLISARWPRKLSWQIGTMNAQAETAGERNKSVTMPDEHGDLARARVPSAMSPCPSTLIRDGLLSSAQLEVCKVSLHHTNRW